MVKQFASQQPLAANPYAVPRTIEPAITNCVLCHRPIKTKDWSAHKNSKAHRKREDEERRAENGFEGGAVNIPFGTDIPVATEASLNSWGSPEAANFSAGGANASGGNPCYECGEQGHMKRDCPKAGTRSNACFNCELEGHRANDCPEPRKARGGGDRACFNCDMVGHLASECTKPRKVREGGGRDNSQQECFNCYQTGHRKSECPNERVMKCRNCDGIGHESRDCPQPKDWTRVKCNNCQEMGHTIKRCKAPAAENTAGGWGNSGSGAVDSGVATGGWDTAADTDTAVNDTASSWADDVPADAQWGAANPNGSW